MTLTYSDRIMQAIKLALDARMPVIEKKLNKDLANGEGFGTPLVTLDVEITPLPKRGKRVRKASVRISTKWTAGKEFVTVELDDQDQTQLPMDNSEPADLKDSHAEREDRFTDAAPEA